MTESHEFNFDEVRILPRFIRDDSHVNGRVATIERCPRCNFITQNFEVVNPKTLACIQCGVLFRSRRYMDELRPRVNDILKLQEAREELRKEGFEVPDDKKSGRSAKKVA